MKFRREDIQGWVGSLVIHVLAGIFLFLWNVSATVREPEFIELSWGTVTSVPTRTPSRPSSGSSGGAGAVISGLRRSNVELPVRKFSGPDEILKTGATRKLDVEERPVPSRVQIADGSRGQKERGVSTGIGEKEIFRTPGKGEGIGDVSSPLAEGASMGSVGSSVSVSMQWTDGGTRRKLSGNLPAYPPGVNVEAQIKIEAVVVPDGSVKSLKPVQKANTKLEEAALKEVRLWKFEALKASVSQRDQTCLITFNFRLQ
jgi:hypothetical protein